MGRAGAAVVLCAIAGLQYLHLGAGATFEMRHACPRNTRQRRDDDNDNDDGRVSGATFFAGRSESLQEREREREMLRVVVVRRTLSRLATPHDSHPIPPKPHQVPNPIAASRGDVP
jgi:hypothetical protein